MRNSSYDIQTTKVHSRGFKFSSIIDEIKEKDGFFNDERKKKSVFENITVLEEDKNTETNIIEK